MLLPYEEKDHLTSRIVKECEDAFLLRRISTHSRDKEYFYDELFKELELQRDAIIKLGKLAKLGTEEKTIAILVRYNWQISNIVKEGERRGITVRTAEGGTCTDLRLRWICTNWLWQSLIHIIKSI